MTQRIPLQTNDWAVLRINAAGEPSPTIKAETPGQSMLEALMFANRLNIWAAQDNSKSRWIALPREQAIDILTKGVVPPIEEQPAFSYVWYSNPPEGSYLHD